MNLKQALTALITTGSFSVYAQESLNAAGGNVSASSGSVSYSVGQISYQSISQAGGLINEGVQQPFELMTLSLEDGLSEIRVSVFPNPSSDYFVLEFPLENNNRNYFVRDLNGRLLIKGDLSGLKNSIPANDLAPAEYLLEITEGSTSQTFKLIKN